MTTIKAQPTSPIAATIRSSSASSGAERTNNTPPIQTTETTPATSIPRKTFLGSLEMKKLIPICCALWLGLSQIAFCDFNPSYNPTDWPRHIIRFPTEGTLKDIFDAGIRPYRFPSLEKSSLGFKHIHASFETKTGELLPSIPVEWGDISPLKDGLLDNIELTSPNLSIQEAEAAMVPFLKKSKRSIEELRKFLAAAAADPRNYDDPYNGDSSKFAITWIDTDGPAYGVFLKSTFDGSKPVSIAIKVSFFPIRTPLQKRSFYDIPIPPPPGYEDVSMEAPRNFGPDSAVEIARSKGISITGDRSPEEYEKQWREANGKDRALKSGTPETEGGSVPSGESTSWPWIIAGVLLLGILFRFFKVWMGGSAR